MFYSQLLVSKKGALGIIWMAAHCHKRLKKDQVQQTNISSYVDKILNDEVPVVTHRILAFLLLGIVRIYSKKVEYLFEDCHEVLNRLCSFKAGKRALADVAVSLNRRHYDSITLPKRFELDTFDLGIDLDAMGVEERAREQDTHTDGRRKDSGRSGSFCKDIIPVPEAQSTAHTPPRDVFGAHCMDLDLLVKPSSKTNISLASVEMFRQTRRSLDDCIDLVLLNETEQEQMHYKLSNRNWRTNCQGPSDDDSNSDSDSATRLSNSRILSLPSLEMPRGIGLSLEDRLEPMVLDEAEEEQLYDRPSTSKVQWPVRVVELNSVVNQSHEESNPVENIDILQDDSAMHLVNRRILSLPGLEDHLEPMVLDEAEQEQLYDRPSSSHVQGPIQNVESNHVANQSHEGSNHVKRMDILHESNFSLEHLPSFKLLNLAEKREDLDKPTNEDRAAEEKHMDRQSNQLSFQEGLDLVFTEAVDNTRPACPELEVVPPESVKCQKPENSRLSIDSIPKPHSKLPAADVCTVEVAAVQTPGRKERAKILKKRKALFDLATVLPTMVMKSWIDDPTDLKRGRKKVPRTLLQAWRHHKLSHAPHSFLEPSIPGASVNFGYYGCPKSDAPEIISADSSVGQEQIPEIRSTTEQQISDIRVRVADKTTGQTADFISMEIEKSQEQAPDVRSPIAETSSDQIPIAPGTPVAYLSSLRSHEAERIADSDILQPSVSLEGGETSTSSSEKLGLGAFFQEETSSYRGDSLEKEDAFSARTRMMGSYLGRKFLHKKRRKEEQVLNLSCLLAGKTKKESTIMFYEILVLKTQACIDVQQETAYCDILVRETPTLRQFLHMSKEYRVGAVNISS